MVENLKAEPTGASGDDRQEFLTIEEVSKRVKVKTSFFYAPERRKGSDPVPCVKVGKYLRYRFADVLEWLERQNRKQE